MKYIIYKIEKQVSVSLYGVTARNSLFSARTHSIVTTLPKKKGKTKIMVLFR